MHLMTVVNFRDNKSTFDLIKSFSEANLIDFVLLVVDNSPVDKDLANFISRLNDSSVIYHKNKDNLGYFPGAFTAIQNLSEHYDSYIVGNTDLLIVDLTHYQNIISDADSLNNIGVIAPCIESQESGNNQNPFLIVRPSRLRYLLWVCIFANRFITIFLLGVLKVRRYFKKKKGIHCKNWDKIYASQGSLFIFTKKFIDSGYDGTKLPMLYAEEISVAEHCLMHDLDVVINNQIKFIHKEHQTTGAGLSKFKYDRQREAQAFILREYYS